jgi:chorismate mutase
VHIFQHLRLIEKGRESAIGDQIEQQIYKKRSRQAQKKITIDDFAKSLFKAVIPEVLNRESTLFK